ncbi:glycosyl transferase [Clostridiales bacterium F-3ap]|uniref:Glycosyl transferase n=2 Tax=Anaerotalea alkaliphila TaxID=2662126 RepID=A0A7X5HTG5_9FIRM|nr:glycosyl transferase [Anaerotalea alkaliphila]
MGMALLSVLAVWFVWRKVRINRNIHIRDASLTVEELEDHARRISLDHAVSRKRNILNWPLTRMNDNYVQILLVYKGLNEDIQRKRSVPPAAEWLLDNFYVVEEQVKGIRRDLSKKQHDRLPVLRKGPYKGYTRIFAIAMELVAHVDGQVEEDTLRKYLEAYQTHNILFEREISALPTMIRLALIENIRMATEKIKETQTQWKKADEVAKKWLEEDSIKLFQNGLEPIEVNPSFVEHLFYRLRKSGRNYANVLLFMDENLEKLGTTTEAVASKEHHAQAINTVSMGNCITSLKAVGTMDWSALFESASFLDKTLRQDPDGTYRLMDMSTRSHYKREAEKIARAYGVSELHIGREAVLLAEKASKGQTPDQEVGNAARRRLHVGYYLTGNGLKELEDRQQGQGKRTPWTRVGLWVKGKPEILYMGSVGVLTLLVGAFAVGHVADAQGGNLLFHGVLAGLAVLLPASEMAISMVNWLVCKFSEPAIFPRLELKGGIPDNMRTMVVMPALLTDEKRVEELLENMEIHYLANREDNLYFALIGAFKDADSLNTDGDRKVLAEAFDGIKALNGKYAREGKDIFYFYHRLRQFNESDNNWMGWERKRGALMEFNEMLLGSQDTSFSYYSNASLPHADIKYIITLDADTVLPLGTAKRMIGTMAHPLNIPIVDREKGIVVEGYGLMQPRITFDMDSSNRSAFSRIFTGQEGIDPYASAISDVYQDLFGEGIFTGKGIYDLHVFHGILKDAIPENAILSHDLLEGSYVRVALVSDLELVDSYPSKYNSYMARLYRWIRGDWQLLPWLGRKVSNANNERIQNPLSKVSRWKIGDNLRRSLLAPAIMALYLLGFSILPGSPYFWVGIGIATMGLPHAITILGQVFSGGLRIDRIKSHIPGFFGLKASLFQFMLSGVFLSYQAAIVLHGIFITLFRVLVSKKNMLVWVTSADAEKTQKNTLGSYLSAMGPSALAGAGMVALAARFKPEHIAFSLVFLAVWGMAPFVAYLVSRDIDNEEERLEAKDLMELGRTARRTWRYFEEFANRKNNYLAPDNFQEDPPRGIAYRTSPTNVGLGLLASLSARDLGYAGTLDTVDAIAKTVATMEKMEKWNGHLYNWYDTRTLQPLKPLYVSTVDSGNLVCYLTTLAQGLEEYGGRPLVDASFLQGIKDTLRNGLQEEENLPALSVHSDFMEREDEINLVSWNRTLDGILSGTVPARAQEQEWNEKVERMAGKFKEDLERLAPWAALAETMPNEMREDILAVETEKLLGILKENVCLKDLCRHSGNILEQIDGLMEETEKMEGKSFKEGRGWLERLKEAATVSKEFHLEFMENLRLLIQRIQKLSMETQFSILYDERRQLFSIGYDVEERKLSNSHYDLLASEARQTSFIAIARGEVPAKHWAMLGRSLTVVDRFKGLVSWSGTMFEYLMPLLLMKSYRNTLLDESYSFVVKSQKKYGKQRGMPWGTSESSYNSLDLNLDYQYKAIGVPWLGLKRGLSEDAVTAPYATFLALMASPREAYRNLRRLKAEGLEGAYGYYEAADYTPERLDANAGKVVVKSFMAHHQGMSLLALNNYLNGNIMQKRFAADPHVKAARLLLQEKVPMNVVFTKESKEKVVPAKGKARLDKGVTRRYTAPDGELPRAHVLSNGDYSVMVTERGTGYSRNKTVDLARWREDDVQDGHGMFFYIKDIDRNRHWSAAYAPLQVLPEKYEAVFTSDKAVFRRTDGDIETSTEVAVAAGDDGEIRRIKLKNNGKEPCVLEVTSYYEVVLAPRNNDEAHPAFSNLFVRTEFNEEHHALLANRRPRGGMDKEIWAAQVPVIDGESVGEIQYETDRMQFIGRGRTVGNPAGMEREKPLSNTVGAVLDPIFCLRAKLRIEPGKTAEISFASLMADSKEGILERIEKYSGREACDAAFRLALAGSQVEAKYLNIQGPKLEMYLESIANILYASPLRRKQEQMIKENRKGQASLWPYGISGDRPIVLVILKAVEEIELLGEVLKAHEYWRLKDLRVDLVVLGDEAKGGKDRLFPMLEDIAAANRAQDVFLLNAREMPAEDGVLFGAVARMVFRGDGGTMEKQLRALPKTRLPGLEAFPEVRGIPSIPATEEALGLSHFNGLGGFSGDGSAYVIRLEKGQMTPLPWVNVIANPEFGFMVSESGGGHTWCENSRENKLTPWSNDPVCDTPGETFYIRDDSGETWSLTPLPIREEEPYTVRHGFGHTQWSHASHGISQELVQFVPVEGKVKVSMIRLQNDGPMERKVWITCYAHPVLGVGPKDTALHLVSSQNERGMLLLENPYNREFEDRVCFLDVSMEERSVTGDRREFFGLGKADAPESLKRKRLSGAVGAGYAPCAAMQVELVLGANETRELVFVLGMAVDGEKAQALGDRFRDVEKAKESLLQVKRFWQEKLQVVQVRTPDGAMDLLLNGWLSYQVISCRLWAKSGFYQAGGAFGFRDQLQDSLAVATLWPEMAKRQILKHARHQFAEGDVLHWWHEPAGKGTRTRISDDYLWLPFVTAEYVRLTGDAEILNIDLPFLEAEVLREGEEERYCTPEVSAETASLYGHCIRSLENGLKFGEHGLPLMGTGDWNDGMNAVGNGGKGESVWLGWFLVSTLEKFLPLCRLMGEEERVDRYGVLRRAVIEAIEESAWDGNWYKRAFFDNGSALGSANNSECRIDSLAQTWAVLSGGGDPERAKRAMRSLEDHLVLREEGIIKLLTPPFKTGDMKPGYIQGYLPGVRENGGQYTHAAAWVVGAFALLGDGDKAGELFGLLNPINHTRTDKECAVYKGEPYVMAADVYGEHPHVGRGGWTWYTGSASWMYRTGLENILGFRKVGDRLEMDPCIPTKWTGYAIRYTHLQTTYEIQVKNPGNASKGVSAVTVDGKRLEGKVVQLVNDKGFHQVEFVLGPKPEIHQ